MREVKFRVWYPNKKRFSDKLYNIIDYLMDIKNGKLVSNVYELANEDTTDIKYFNDDSYVLMQYTGLKDKNGVEIYEGDIVVVKNYNHHGENPKKVMFVYYDNSTAQYCTKVEKTSFKLEDLIMENQPLCFANSFEVIGNIYENPELLKED